MTICIQTINQISKHIEKEKKRAQNMIASMLKFFVQSTGWNYLWVTNGSQCVVFNQPFTSIRNVNVLGCEFLLYGYNQWSNLAH